MFTGIIGMVLVGAFARSLSWNALMGALFLVIAFVGTWATTGSASTPVIAPVYTTANAKRFTGNTLCLIGLTIGLLTIAIITTNDAPSQFSYGGAFGWWASCIGIMVAMFMYIPVAFAITASWRQRRTAVDQNLPTQPVQQEPQLLNNNQINPVNKE